MLISGSGIHRARKRYGTIDRLRLRPNARVERCSSCKHRVEQATFGQELFLHRRYEAHRRAVQHVPRPGYRQFLQQHRSCQHPPKILGPLSSLPISCPGLVLRFVDIRHVVELIRRSVPLSKSIPVSYAFDHCLHHRSTSERMIKQCGSQFLRWPSKRHSRTKSTRYFSLERPPVFY